MNARSHVVRNDALFARFYEGITKYAFGEHMNPKTIIKTVKGMGFLLWNKSEKLFGICLGKLTTHRLRKGLAQNRFFT